MPIARVPLRVLRLLRRGRDRVEAIEGEEDDRRCAHHPVFHPVRRRHAAIALGCERVQIGPVEMRQRHRDEQRQRYDLQHHQCGVDPRALARAQHQQPGDERDDEYGRQVDHSAQRRSVGQRRGNDDAQPVQETDRIARPADRDGRHHKGVFEDQRPADHPGDHLAQHRIAVGVGAARRRDGGRHLRIAQRRAGADRTGDDEAQQHRRPGAVRTDADQRQDAGADDRADAERDQVRPRQRPGELLPGGALRDDRFPAQQAVHRRPPVPAELVEALPFLQCVVEEVQPFDKLGGERSRIWTPP